MSVFYIRNVKVQKSLADHFLAFPIYILLGHFWPPSLMFDAHAIMYFILNGTMSYKINITFSLTRLKTSE